MKRVVFARYQFWDYQRGEGQSFDEFLTQIKTFARACEFLEVDNMIRDKIVFSSPDKSLKQRLLRQVDLNLQRAVNLCRSAETTHKEIQSMKSIESKTVAEKAIHGIKSKSRAGQAKPIGQKCRRCGNEHPIRKCPAWGLKCAKSGGGNHFARMCLSRNTASQVHKVSAQQSKNTFFIDTLYTGNISATEENNKSAWFTVINVHNSRIRMKLDTGAAANILPLQIFCKLKKPPQLNPSNVKLKAYGGHPVEHQGKIKLSCSVRGHESKLEFFYCYYSPTNFGPQSMSRSGSHSEGRSI